MKQTAIFPGRYVQAEGAIETLAEEVQRLGANALVIAGGTAERTLVPRHLPAWRARVPVTVERFGGESSEEEIQRLTKVAEARECDVVADIGVGDASDSDLRIVADAACAEGETIHHEPCPISPAAVVAALKTANQFGRSRLRKLRTEDGKGADR